jgi:type VI secretion system secreted protein VgrG
VSETNELFFAWDGADHPDGPWHHLKILELRGEEAISRLFHFDIELYHDQRGADVEVEALVGAAAAIKIATRTEPGHRIVHGVVTSAVELELADAAGFSRYRVRVEPPLVRAAMMKKSIVYLDKTLREIITQALERTSLGAALQPSGAPRPLAASAALDSYQAPRQTYAWAVEDVRRLDDKTARPYCVQYDESDFAFVSRLLEEEGISYHFEHADDECALVVTDFDGGRIDRSGDAPFGPNLAGREVFDWRAGGRLRPRSVHLGDYNWRKPNLDLNAISPAGVTEFTDMAHPGRYEETPEHGLILAEKREQRLDAERVHASARSHCRLLTAATVMRLEHSNDRFNGTYLVTQVRHHAIQRDWAGQGRPGEPYRQELELVRCGKGEVVAPSAFRPERVTRRPRIYGSQTAVVTADPADPEAEIHVGGPSDLGCVRVKFHWDMDSGRHAQEPTSCWVRVSQFFAGADHGALWHPRVGDEVIVEHLDGDPDRPIITGRVYNGTHPAPENATARPTYSAIKSNTSPYNGNYNLIAFEDLQGAEEIIIHAARDWNSNVERNCSRGVGLDDTVHVKGDQSIHIEGKQDVVIGKSQTISVETERVCDAGTSITDQSMVIEHYASATFGAHAGSMFRIDAGSIGVVTAPVTRIDANILLLIGHAVAKMFGGVVDITGGSEVGVTSPTINIKGGTINISGGVVNITGAPVKIVGGAVDIDGEVIELN